MFKNASHNRYVYVRFIPASLTRATEQVRKLAVPTNFREFESQSSLSSVTVEESASHARGERRFG